ncbi:hypothetical protein K3495_g7517 [Podosphaera aphanis]|nr:hypothetical protein K3495_g7517 [Podosphaera aphanis]
MKTFEEKKDAALEELQQYSSNESNPLASKNFQLGISEISTAELHLAMQTENNIIFTTSLHEIDRELDLRVDKSRDTEEDLQEIYGKLPEFLKRGSFFVEDFSRVASDTLSPDRS